jgi:hypothetical protein
MNNVKSLILLIAVLQLFNSLSNSANAYNKARPVTFLDTFEHEFIGMKITTLGKKYGKASNVTELQTNVDNGGSTSIRQLDETSLPLKTEGYYQRNRDLGQIFIPKKQTQLKSIVIRTGPSENAVLYNTPGAEIFIQFFEISGTPIINDNGTPMGTNATHGFTSNHRADNYIDGIEYISLSSIYIGRIPTDFPITKDQNGNLLGNKGKLLYLRMELDSTLLLEANKIYGFMVGLIEAAPGRGFTLANNNKAGVTSAPSLNDSNTPYKGGWAFRREGNGALPPAMHPGTNPPADSATKRSLIVTVNSNNGQITKKVFINNIL